MRKFPSTRELSRLTKPGRYAVGHGAYLQISEWGTRAWIFRYRRDGKAHHLGLGSEQYVTLAKHVRRHLRPAKMITDCIDPLAAKRQAKHERALASTRAKTFKHCALDYIAAHEDGWRGDRSRKQWLDSLAKHAFPKIGHIPVAAVDVAAVLSVLDPIARTIPETESRVRNRISLILDWAAARELRSHDNPAKRPNRAVEAEEAGSTPRRTEDADIRTFMIELRQRSEIGARALEFAILTAARPSEALGARWSEIEGDTWIIPPDRMKGGRGHKVPLPDAAVKLLAGLPRVGEYIFGNSERPGPLTLIRMLRRMGHAVTAHGFRATFKTWADEQTAFANHIVEMALAHAVGNAVEAAYRRGDLFEKRRRLMEDWAEYCGKPVACASGKVVVLRGVS